MAKMVSKGGLGGPWLSGLVLILVRLCIDQKTVWSVKCCLSDSIVSLDVETVGLIDLRMGW